MEELEVLIIEDSEDDALRLVNELYRIGFDPKDKRVFTAEDTKNALENEKWDIILSDFDMPDFTGLDALNILKQTGKDIPFILISGAIGEELAADIMLAGANDFISKNNLSRLGPSIRRELKEAEVRKVNRAALEQLKESEKRCRVLLTAISAGVFLIDPEDDNILDVNPAACQLVGLAEDEIIGKNSREFLLQSKSTEKYSELTADGASETSELILLDVKKREIPVINTIKNVRLHERQLLLNCFYDISDRVMMENALKESEERYQELIHRQGEGICIADLQDNIIFSNPAAEEIFGVARGSLTGRNLREFLTNDGERIIHEQTNIRMTGTKTSYELDIIRDNGEVRHLLITGTPKLNPGDVFEGSFGVIRDITERKRAEEQVREQRDFAESLIETAQAIVLLLSEEGRIIRFNKYTEELTGYKLVEVKDRKWFDIFLPEYEQNRIKKVFKSALDGKTKGITRNDIRCKSGEIRTLEWSDKPLLNSKGEFLGLLAIGQDITERKQAQEALHNSEAQLSNAAKMAKLGPWEYDVANDLFTFTDAFYAIFKTTVDEVGSYQLHSQEYAERFVYPEDAMKVGNEVRKAIETDNPFFYRQLEHRIIYADGEVGYISVRFFVVKDENGKTIKTIGVNQDITERVKAEEGLRESEEKHRVLFEGTTEGILIADIDTQRFIYANPAICRMLGYSGEELMEMNILQIHPAESLDLIDSEFEAQLSGDKKLATNMPCIRKNGDIMFADISNALVSINGRECNAGFFTDITERKALEEQLRQSQKLESIGTLAAGIAHEINTPTQFIGDNLTFLKDSFADLDKLLVKYSEFKSQIADRDSTLSILGEIDNIAEEIDIEYLLEELPNAISQSLDGASRISKIVQAMREFAHPGVEEKSYIDINKAIESTVTVSRNEWKYIADLRTDFTENLPSIPCIPGEVNQVFLNIIVNAAQALKEKAEAGNEERGLITVSTRLNGNMVEIDIADNGPGISDSIINRIFDPFFTTKEVGKGTGQGLAIAHTVIVKKHSGKIHVDSRTGSGTTFTIELPINSD